MDEQRMPNLEQIDEPDASLMTTRETDVAADHLIEIWPVAPDGDQ